MKGRNGGRPVDVLVVAAPAPAAVRALEECIANRYCETVLLHSAGFAETVCCWAGWFITLKVGLTVHTQGLVCKLFQLRSTSFSSCILHFSFPGAVAVSCAVRELAQSIFPYHHFGDANVGVPKQHCLTVASTAAKFQHHRLLTDHNISQTICF